MDTRPPRETSPHDPLGIEPWNEAFEMPRPPTFVQQLPTVADVRTRLLNRGRLPLSRMHFHDGTTIFVGNYHLQLSGWVWRQLLREIGARPATGWNGSPLALVEDGPPTAEMLDLANRLLDTETELRMVFSGRTRHGHEQIRSLIDSEHAPLLEGDLLHELHRLRHPRVGRLKVLRIETTAHTTQIILVDERAVDLGTADAPDLFHPSLSLYSDGNRPRQLSIGTAWYQAASHNVLILTEKDVAVRTSSDNRLTDTALTEPLNSLFSAWDDRARKEEEGFRAAKGRTLPAWSKTIQALLKQAGAPAPFKRLCLTTARQELPISPFSIAQVIARLAHTNNGDPDLRYRLERAAGTLVLGT